MVCGFCGEDFSDTYQKIKGSKRKVFGPLDHYMMPYMIKGQLCPNCNKVMEYMLVCTGNLFHKTEVIKDEKLLYTFNDYWSFLEKKGLLEEFRKYKNINLKLKLNGGQPDLFDNNE